MKQIQTIIDIFAYFKIFFTFRVHTWMDNDVVRDPNL